MKNEERNIGGQINLSNAVIDFECQINILNILNVAFCIILSNISC